MAHLVNPKKALGQHFLKDEAIAMRIAGTLSGTGYDAVLEIGPGMGVLTRHLLDRKFADLRAVEVDRESVQFLRKNLPSLENILEADFLKLDLKSIFSGTFAVTGNFPYNISSQIMFRVLEYHDLIPEVTGMFQKEVAERICAPPGSRTYGILSVLIQAYYKTEYLFTVNENVFIPPPKVKSGVIRLTRNSTAKLDCDEKLFLRVVKGCFNQRRKTLRNSIRSAFPGVVGENPMLTLRPEQLGVEQFVELTNWVAGNLE